MQKKQQGFLIRSGNKYTIDASKTKSVILNQLHIDILLQYKKLFKGKLLDAGCGERPYRLLYDELVDNSIGCDVEACIHDKDAIDVFASLDCLPFEDEEFDTVLCTNVLEHVANAQEGFMELGRVLKPKGMAILSTPFLYPLHEAPFDFYRYTVHGLKYQIERSGLCVKRIIPLGGVGLMAVVYWHLFVTRFLRKEVLSGIDCIVQKAFYFLYKRICFAGICRGGGDKGLSSIMSCGYVMIAKKE